MPLTLIVITLLLNVGVIAALVVVLRDLRAMRSSGTPGGAPRPARDVVCDSVLQALPDPIVVVGPNGVVREELGGAAPGAGRALLQQLPDDAHEAFLRALNGALATQREESLRFARDDRWINAQIIPLPPGAQLGAAAVVFRDATHEKDSAARLDRLAKRNQAILRSAMDGFFVVGEDYSFVEVNDAFCRMVGFDADELRQLKITDLEVNQPARGLATTAGRTGLHHLVGAHRHKSGHVVQLELSVIALRDEGRRILVGFARDATERVRAEQRLREANERFESLVARMPLGYIVWAPDFRVLEWNAAAREIFGFAPTEALGRHAYDLIVGREDRLAVGRMWDETVNGDGAGAVLVSNVRKSGEPITCEWFNTVLRGPDGAVHSIATMVRDVSEPQRLQTQLRHSQKLESLGVLAGGVAHDFNNFLVSILCNASLVAERLPHDSEARRHLQKIINASRRASELTRQMLTYAGRGTFDVQPLDLNALVRELGDFLRAALARNVSLTFNLHERLPLIDADSGQIQQVVMNLLINASEAIGQKPGLVSIETATVELDARRIALEFAEHNLTPGTYVRLTVMDSGCGMAPETVARIFDPFFTTKFTGRGLGLATILGIVRAHRGAIKVVSALNQGTEFAVLLPVSRQPAPAAPPTRSGPSSLPPGATVLVIDDEADIREVVHDILESRGAKVLVAENGARGIELFQKHVDEIGAVLLDMTMPGMSGDTVCREVHALRPGVPVILSSGYSEHEATSRFGGERFAAFVQKPYSIDALVETCATVLSAPPPAGSGGRT
ncbi:MAG: PAS domain S-box protein [Phycisphaerae bacterium]